MNVEDSEVIAINDTDVNSSEAVRPVQTVPSAKTTSKEPLPHEPDTEETPNDNAKRLEHIQRITDYKTTFPKHLQHVNLDGLEGMTSEELQQLVDECRYKVGVRNSGNIIPLAYRYGVVGIESVACSFTPIKLQGFANNACQEYIMDIVNEIALEYGQYTYVRPEYRLAQALFGVAAITHSNNTIKEATKPKEEEETSPPENLQEKYDGL